MTYDRNLPIALGGWGTYTLADRMTRGLPVIVHGDGSSLWVVTHADDLARGILGLLGNEGAVGQAFHITSDEVLTWNQIYQTIAEALGVEAEIVHIPSDFIAHVAPADGREPARRQDLERGVRQHQDQGVRAGLRGHDPLARGHPPDAVVVLGRCDAPIRRRNSERRGGPDPGRAIPDRRASRAGERGGDQVEYRELGRTGWKVSAIGLGTWAMGSSWGPVDDAKSFATLNRALDLGVNFFDTADVYGSEPLLGRLRRERTRAVLHRHQAGRAAQPRRRGYTRDNMTAASSTSSLRDLGVETIDLHAAALPADRGLQRRDVRHPRRLVARARSATTASASSGSTRPSRPSSSPACSRCRSSSTCSASGPPRTSSRKPTTPRGHPRARATRLGHAHGQDDARHDVRARRPPHLQPRGRAFDRGETFSGVDFETGLQAVEELRALVPPGPPWPQLALRWILMYDDVSCVIAGARRPAQAEDNIAAADLPPLSAATMEGVRQIYDRHLRPHVHHLW